jgi:hypothetical protein
VIASERFENTRFKLTVYYVGAMGLDRTYEMYGETEHELMSHYFEVKHVWARVKYVTLTDCFSR